MITGTGVEIQFVKFVLLKCINVHIFSIHELIELINKSFAVLSIKLIHKIEARTINFM